MSYPTVKAAVAPLLVAGITSTPAVQVFDRNQIDTLLPPENILPCVLLRDRPHTETPLAIGAADSVWWLDCMLWNAYPIDADQSAFDTMREQVKSVLRSHTWLGGNADDATFGTKLYVSGRSLQVHDYPAFSVNAQMYRHCLISSLIRESVSFSAF